MNMEKSYTTILTKMQLAAAEVPEGVKTRIWRTVFGDMPTRKSGGGKGYQGQSDFEIFKDLTKVI